MESILSEKIIEKLFFLKKSQKSHKITKQKARKQI